MLEKTSQARKMHWTVAMTVDIFLCASRTGYASSWMIANNVCAAFRTDAREAKPPPPHLMVQFPESVIVSRSLVKKTYFSRKWRVKVNKKMIIYWSSLHTNIFIH